MCKHWVLGEVCSDVRREKCGVRRGEMYSDYHIYEVFGLGFFVLGLFVLGPGL